MKPSIRLQLFTQSAETQPSLFNVAPLPKLATSPGCPHPLLSWKRQASLFPNTADGIVCTACNGSLPRFAPIVAADGTRGTLHLTCAVDRCDSVRILHESTNETTCTACTRQ
jgi:hypothetical protein